MALRQFLTERAVRLAQHPRAAAALQNPSVVRAIRDAFEWRARQQRRIDERFDRLARSLNFATKRELRELKRHLRQLEQELERSRERL